MQFVLIEKRGKFPLTPKKPLCTDWLRKSKTKTKNKQQQQQKKNHQRNKKQKLKTNQKERKNLRETWQEQ